MGRTPGKHQMASNIRTDIMWVDHLPVWSDDNIVKEAGKLGTVEWCDREKAYTQQWIDMSYDDDDVGHIY